MVLLLELGKQTASLCGSPKEYPKSTLVLCGCENALIAKNEAIKIV
jgi:hypothetical protein